MKIMSVDTAEAVKHPLADSLLELLPAYESNMPTSFRLSVLVPVYNERHVVATSLRRVLALEDPLINGLEVIVVDDRSTDGSTLRQGRTSKWTLLAAFVFIGG